MSRHAARRPARRGTAVRVLTVALLVGAVVALAGVRGTFALFTDAATVTAGAAAGPTPAFGSGAVATPVTPTATQGSGGVALSWTATKVGSQTAVATGYQVVRYAAATGGAGTVVCTTTGALSCVDASPVNGTSYYGLRARFADNWFNEGSRRSLSFDNSAPGNLRCSNGFLGLGTYVFWDAASGSVDGYVVTWTLNGTSDSVDVGTATRWRPSGAMANGTYTVRVAAVRAGVTSPLSTSSDTISKSSGLDPYQC